MRIKLIYSDGSEKIKNFKSEKAFLNSAISKDAKLKAYAILLELFDLAIKIVNIVRK